MCNFTLAVLQTPGPKLDPVGARGGDTAEHSATIGNGFVACGDISAEGFCNEAFRAFGVKA